MRGDIKMTPLAKKLLMRFQWKKEVFVLAEVLDFYEYLKAKKK